MKLTFQNYYSDNLLQVIYKTYDFTCSSIISVCANALKPMRARIRKAHCQVVPDERLVIGGDHGHLPTLRSIDHFKGNVYLSTCVYYILMYTCVLLNEHFKVILFTHKYLGILAEYYTMVRLALKATGSEGRGVHLNFRYRPTKIS